MHSPTGVATMIVNNTIHRRLAITLVLLGASAPTSAQTVYKCTDAGGHIGFQATPCASSQREQRVEMQPAPPVAHVLPPARMVDKRPTRVSTPKAPRAARETPSFECRSAGGALFYRHSGCPKSIPRSAGGSTARGKGAGGDAVTATRIARRDACRRIGTFGRTGREHDETVSTYERNAGRDPCRRF